MGLEPCLGRQTQLVSQRAQAAGCSLHDAAIPSMDGPVSRVGAATVQELRQRLNATCEGVGAIGARTTVMKALAIQHNRAMRWRQIAWGSRLQCSDSGKWRRERTQLHSRPPAASGSLQSAHASSLSSSAVTSSDARLAPISKSRKMLSVTTTCWGWRREQLRTTLRGSEAGEDGCAVLANGSRRTLRRGVRSDGARASGCSAIAAQQPQCGRE